MSVTVLVFAVLIVLFAAIATGYTGFAFNLLTVPLLGFVMPVKQAVIVAMLLGLCVSVMVALRNRGDIQWATLRTLVLGIVPGVVLGAVTFRWIDEAVLRVCVGVLTVVLVIYLFRRRAQRGPHKTRRAATGVGVGALGGTLSALTGMGGPPVVAYLAHVTDRSAHIRATMAATAGFMQVTGLVAHSVSGELTTSQAAFGLALVPAALLGVLAGSVLFHRASKWYPTAVGVTLVLVGVMGIAMPVFGALR